MLKVTPFDEITRFDLARKLPIRWRYWTTAYLVDGMLVDSGCAHSALELVTALADTPLTCIVNTHTHEDQSVRMVTAVSTPRIGDMCPSTGLVHLG